MKRLFIKRDEIINITGWGKTKTGEICRLIRFLYSYPTNRKDILVKDFCDYLELNELDVQQAISEINRTQIRNVKTKQAENTAHS